MTFTESLTPEIKIGQLLFFGFSSPFMCDHARRAIREKHIGNVILFSRNFRNPEQLFSLIQELQHEAMEANGIPLFVAADQEGGQITRFTNGLTWFNGEMATRAAGGPDLAEKVGEGIGAEMASMGLNFNLAPVVDLANNPKSPHIGSRSYGDTPDAIIEYAQAFIRGAQKHVIATAKHFPSIGGSEADLHLSLSRNSRSRDLLLKYELAPVSALAKGGVKCIMTSHEIYTALDTEPGTLSKQILESLLRNTYGYQNLIISDCMEMKALADHYGTPEGCVRAVQAGVDLLLVCHTEAVQHASADALLKALQSGRITQERLDRSVERILREKQKIDISSFLSGKCPDTQNHDLFTGNRALAERIAEKAITAYGKQNFFHAGEDERFLFIAPTPAAVTMLDEKDGAFSAVGAIQKAFPKAVCTEYSSNLDSHEAEQLKGIFHGDYSRIFFCTYNAHLNQNQQELLQYAMSSGKQVGVIALRNPFDLQYCTGAAAVLLTYEYTPTSINALVRLFQGRIVPQGRLPIGIESGGL